MPVEYGINLIFVCRLILYMPKSRLLKFLLLLLCPVKEINGRSVIKKISYGLSQVPVSYIFSLTKKPLTKSEALSMITKSGVGYTNFATSYNSRTPISPFLLKDWEHYDVSRYVDLGCISPEDGQRTIDVPFNES